jgi:3-oxoacyl-[acyl-carrier protein] reductase
MNSSPYAKVAIVTGASTGIGREISISFPQAGVAVVLASRNRGQLEEVAECIASLGGSALFVPTDIADPASVHDLVRAALSRFGKIDILINNAGANYISSLVLSNDQRWKRMFDVNVFGVYYSTNAVLPSMIREVRTDH